MRAKYELNRKVYQKIRKMDHGEMTAFLQSVYDSGFNDAGKCEYSRQDVSSALASVAGIGEAAFSEVMAALEA